ncbi:MAG: hypothetical protein RR636_05280 [Clostridium sp.]|uniref:DUF6115 domain-containing protein n=1 Tax=Clostridium sp. TaxID=1506 RepID=UPI00303EEFCF
MYILLTIIGLTLIILNIKSIKKESNNFQQVMVKTESQVDEVDTRIMKMRSEFGKTLTEIQREIQDLKSNYESVESKDFNNYNDINGKEEIFEYNQDESQVENMKNYECSTSLENYNRINAEDNEEYMSTLVEKIVDFDDEIHITKINQTVKDVNKGYEIENHRSNNSLKVEDVKKLLNQGISDEEIAQSLNIGKGEVLLIKELYLR